MQNTYPLGRTAIIDGASKTLAYVTPATTKIGYVHAGGNIIDRATLAQPGKYALADMDGDGKNEVYFVSLEAFMRIKNTGGNQYTLDTYVAQVSAERCRIYYSTPYIFDLNGNGDKDFFFGAGFNSVSVFAGNMKMTRVTQKTFPLWDLVVSNPNDLMYRDQGIAPVEIDGEILGVVGIQYTSGDMEQRGSFRAYNGRHGKLLWQYDMKELFGGVNVTVKNILSCDIDGDGKVEFIVSTNTGYVAALRSDRDLPGGQERLLWIADIGASISSIAIGDIYNSGKSVIVLAADDGYIHVIKDANIKQ